MHIRPNEIGRFDTQKKAEAYQKAMQVKRDVEEVVCELKGLDDVDGIDFNNNAYGSVIVKDYEQSYRDGLNIKTSGSLIYNQETEKVESLKAEQFKSMSGLPGWRGLVGCFISGDFKFEQKTEKTWTGKEKDVYIQKAANKTQKVSIDKATGEIDYKEYNFGIPSLSNFELPKFFADKT